MGQLSETQITILKAANDREDGTIDAPHTGKQAVTGLIKRGFMIAMPREDGPTALLITNAGRAEITLAPQIVEGVEAAPPPAPARAPAGKTKLAALVDLLKQPAGATIKAIMEATGWQAHSVRGAMSGSLKKGMGLTIVSEKLEGGRVYRIETSGAADASAGQ
jgi:hypothetical protein